MKNSPSSSEVRPSKGSGPSPSVIDRLFADPVWTENYRITSDEKTMLANAAMLGEIASERDVLFILNQIRRARLRW
jgi:hypothetical protein